MKKKRVTKKIGDVYKIPLSNSRHAYGHYVFADKKYGPLVQIYDVITNEEVELEQISSSGLLFPPIILGLNAAIRDDGWEKIGNLKLENYEPPDFISAMYDSVNDKMGVWYLVKLKEDKSKAIGIVLPDRYKKLEQLLVWPPDDVIVRIETGINPYDRWLEI
jgi:hypothetical protein